MPICISCNTPVKNLYTTYSKADDRSLGKGVRLTQCPKCKRFADKYVEHDYVVLFIDLVLIKPQVYRHLLFNRLGRTDDKLDPSILRLGILLILFDVYITWARIEKSNDAFSMSSGFSNALIVTQYLFFLTLNVIATLAQHITIRMLVQWFVNRAPRKNRHNRQGSVVNFIDLGTDEKIGVHNNRDTSPNVSSSTRGSPTKSSNSSPTTSHTQQANGSGVDEKKSVLDGEAFTVGANNNLNGSHGSALNSNATSAKCTVGPGHASPSAISTALLVSSCTKLFPILLVIWPTITTSRDEHPNPDLSASMTGSFAHRASSYIGWIVLLNNVEALSILLDSGYLVAGAIAVAGMVCRWLAEGIVLGCVGLVRDGGGNGDGPVGDVLSLWNWMGIKI